MTPLELANYQLDLYGEAKTPVKLDYLTPGDAHVVFGAVRVEGVTRVFFRGSTVKRDLGIDLLALPQDTKLGPVHPGFFADMDSVWLEIQKETEGPWALHGHSLGAGRACELAGVMTIDGHAPVEIVTWGCPRPGFQKLADILSAVPQRHFRNGSVSDGWKTIDPITRIPVTFWPFEYVHPGPPMENVCGVPLEDWNVGPLTIPPDTALAYHRMECYYRAMEGLTGGPQA